LTRIGQPEEVGEAGEVEKLLDGDDTRPVGILAEYPKPLRILCRERVARQREE
jgi:hypothetical protein